MLYKGVKREENKDTCFIHTHFPTNILLVGEQNKEEIAYY